MFRLLCFIVSGHLQVNNHESKLSLFVALSTKIFIMLFKNSAYYNFQKRVADDTLSGIDQERREKFKADVSSAVRRSLDKFHRPECKVGRITSNEDFKYLARKVGVLGFFPVSF